MTRPRQTTKKRPKKNKRDPNKLEPTQVAHIIGLPYQRARNMMLAGAFGPSEYNETSRKLTVSRAAILAWKQKRDARKAPQASPISP